MMKGTRTCVSSPQFSFRPRLSPLPMPHSHRAGWAPEEIGLFIDSYCRDGAPLAMIGAASVVEGKTRASVETSMPLKEAKLHYTKDEGPLVKRKWSSLPAELKGDEIVGPALPEGTTIWLLSATDERGAMTSSGVVFVK